MAFRGTIGKNGQQVHILTYLTLPWDKRGRDVSGILVSAADAILVQRGSNCRDSAMWRPTVVTLENLLEKKVLQESSVCWVDDSSREKT